VSKTRLRHDEKKNQKLLSIGAQSPASGTHQWGKFFGSFFKKEPLRSGFQKRTASLWFSKKNRFALVFKKEPLPSLAFKHLQPGPP
jgi:hypothetical protein